jgi:hypothetical protein
MGFSVEAWARSSPEPIESYLEKKQLSLPSYESLTVQTPQAMMHYITTAQ